MTRCVSWNRRSLQRKIALVTRPLAVSSLQASREQVNVNPLRQAVQVGVTASLSAEVALDGSKAPEVDSIHEGANNLSPATTPSLQCSGECSEGALVCS